MIQDEGLQEIAMTIIANAGAAKGASFGALEKARAEIKATASPARAGKELFNQRNTTCYLQRVGEPAKGSKKFT